MRALLATFCLALFIPQLQAQEFFIQNIHVEGLHRITFGRLLGATELQPYSFMDETDIATALKDIFATGFFDDVSIHREDDRLIILVQERPSIEEINIEGNKLIKTAELLDALRLSGIKQGEIFQSNKFNIMLHELEALYAEQGRYGTQVTATTDILAGNRVRLNLSVVESDAAQVIQINIVGNEHFSNNELRKLINIKRRKRWSKSSAKSQYSRQKLTADLDSIRSHYLNNGFARVTITDSIVAINSAKNLIAISIHIEEGKRYVMDRIRIAGDTILNKSTLEPQLRLAAGDIFSQAKVEESSNAIIARLGEAGYGLAQVNSLYSYKEIEGKLDLTLYVRPGQKTYVRRVQFVGNKKSTHTALRRHIIQMEGAPYSAENTRISLARLRRLSYIKDVQLSRRSIPGHPDQLDLQFTIKEGPSGNIGGGLIYNDVTGLSLNLEYADRNFYGTGNSLSSSVSYSDMQQGLNFRYTQPYLTLDGLRASYFLRFLITDFEAADIGNYALQSSAAGFSLGYPVSNNGRISYGFEASEIHLQLGSNPSTEINRYTVRYGNDYTDLSLISSYSYNNFNRGFKPTAGNSFLLSTGFGFPTNERPSYYEIKLRDNKYFKLSRNIDELSIQLGFNLAYLDSWDSASYLPFYKHYYAGGITTIRGYAGSSLGPTSSIKSNQTGEQISSGGSLGGNLLTNARVEFIFPFPGLSNDVTNLRTSFFWDIGNVFNTRCIVQKPHCEIPYAYDNLKQSAGFMLRWYIQYFPITLVWAYPLNPDEEDRITRFVFAIGTEF